MRAAARRLNSNPRAIASGTPSSPAEGQPSLAGAKVSQMESSARRCLAESSIKRASVTDRAASKVNSGLRQTLPGSEF